jgi:prenyltransferase beta subunit
MLQVARLAPKLLGEAAAAVEEFLREELNTEEGGARDRAGQCDLYYTVFALEGLLGLQKELPVERVERYLLTFGDGEGLDLVHRCCLARCWAALPKGKLLRAHGARIAERVNGSRAADGGFAAAVGSAHGTVYHTFLGVGALQDLGQETGDPAAIAKSVLRQRATDGGFANQSGLPSGVTTVSAAAVTLLRNLGHAVPAGVDHWLFQRAHPHGGFVASPQTPLPDLLSTATALHALVGLHADITPLREPCLDFLDTLWTGRGFCGHWADDAVDCEYTYYALLAMGHLAL